jgi:hypothetical protein
LELAVAIFLLTFTISLGLVGALIVALPVRYFADEQSRLLANHPLVVRWSAKVAKNLAGVALVVLGVLLSVPGIPGQGILTIAIGVVLLDIPGKHRLVRAVVRRKGVLRRINRFRAWFGRAPLVAD